MLNMDFAQAVIIDTAALDWVPSPKAGVWRKPLAREAAERGHATSIVRYDPGANFPAHNHPLGEEILVLSGTFSDATGDFAAGTYFRNPMGFVHAPFSELGCIIFVKLHQFQPDDTTRLAIDTTAGSWQTVAPGVRAQALHRCAAERVELLELAAGTAVPLGDPAGEELLVLAGAVTHAGWRHGTGTWMRFPPGSATSLRAADGARLWRKCGHLHTGAVRKS